MREIIFDTETTGFDPLTGDRMVEIGCIEMVGRVHHRRNIPLLFQPATPICQCGGRTSARAESDTFLSDKPLFAQKADELLEFIADSPLVAHNASFDFGFLNMELEQMRAARESI